MVPAFLWERHTINTYIASVPAKRSFGKNKVVKGIEKDKVREHCFRKCDPGQPFWKAGTCTKA